MSRWYWILICSFVVLYATSAIPVKPDDRNTNNEESYLTERDLVEIRRMLDYFRTVFTPQSVYNNGKRDNYAIKEYERGSENSDSSSESKSSQSKQGEEKKCNHSEQYVIEKDHEDINIGINVVVNQPYIPCDVCESTTPPTSCTSPPPSSTHPPSPPPSSTHPPSPPPSSTPPPSHPPSSTPPPSHPPSSTHPPSPPPSSTPPPSPPSSGW
ncbi:hypothetical protein GpartN1_g3493.t1 [Galdieria partita]|uniref:Uncharacterized protein n=1 Tax=Galdieria partita TaxID=83374 RepID=A0A9C7PXI0_9RHOD|nr:hypothetical protein GpartN1_g3493.t1 [Galdieria partita]